MATIYFGRDGTDPNRSSAGQDIPMALLDKLGAYSKHYRVEPHVINEDERPSPYSAYQHVICHVGEDELNQSFAKAGYYWFQGLSPTKCCELLGIQMPRL